MSDLTYEYMKRVDPQFRKHIILLPSGRHMDEKICPETKQTCEKANCMLWDENGNCCQKGHQTQTTTKKSLAQIIKEYEDMF